MVALASETKAEQGPARNTRELLRWFRTRLTIVVFVFPALAIIGVFHLYATGYNIAMSFTDWTVGTKNFIGLANYSELFRSGAFLNSLEVTAYFLVTVPLTAILAIPVAYLLHYVVDRSYIYRLVLLLPYIVPTVATSLLWGFILSPSPNGVLNSIIRTIGFKRESLLLDSEGIVHWFASWVHLDPPSWMAGPSVAMTLIMGIRSWQLLGFMVLVLYAGMTRIEPTMLDAARVDGASEYQILRKVVVPSLSPTILFVLVVSLVMQFREFNTIFMLTEGGPVRSSETFTMLLFRQFWGDGQLGMGATTATVLFAIILVVTWIQFRLSRRWVHYEGGVGRD